MDAKLIVKREWSFFVKMLFLLGFSNTLTCCTSFWEDPNGYKDKDYTAQDTVSSLQEKEIKTKSGASLYIPVDAVPPSLDGSEGSLVFSIDREEKVSLPNLSADEKASEDIYKFGPSGVVFAEPVRISLPVPDDFNKDENGLLIYRINPNTGEAEQFPAIFDSITNKVSTYTFEFSLYFFAMRKMDMQKRMTYGDGMVKIINSMPVPITVSILSSTLKYHDFNKNFNSARANISIPAAGQMGRKSEIEWYLPQGSYHICIQWNDGHYMNIGHKIYHSIDKFELTRSYNPMQYPEKVFDIYRVGELGSCNNRPVWTPIPPVDDHEYGSITDSRDLKIYKTIKIGKQTWMAENLAYLPAVNISDEVSFTEKRYYVYGYEGNDLQAAKKTENYKLYGALYNWSAAMDEKQGSNSNPSKVQGVCPKGWHLPSLAEWEEMEKYLSNNGYSFDNKLDNYKIAKSMASKILWKDSEFNNAGCITNDMSKNNKSGFSALPGGYCFTNSYNGFFEGIGNYGGWWTSTNYNNSNEWANMKYLMSGSLGLEKSTEFMSQGYSVRCVKD